MRSLGTLRSRLIAMVVALLLVVIGGIAIVSTGVAHYEIRKFEVQQNATGPQVEVGSAVTEHYRLRQSWAGVQPALDRDAKESAACLVLFDRRRQFVAAAPREFHPAHIEMPSDEMVTYAVEAPGGRLRGRIRGPQRVVHDARGTVAGFLFVIPAGPEPGPAPRRALDRWFFWTFLVAAVLGVLMAMAIARWTTRPIEMLTAATRRMEAGDLAVRVQPTGAGELAELAHGFNAMAASLDRNEELRRQMVTDVAHELRAPLTNIRCELESMQDGLTEPTQARIASLHEETMHLARLVDDLQDLSLIDAGQLELDRQPVQIAALVRRAIVGMETRAGEQNLRLLADGPDALMALADSGRTLQIINNLLANAITHSRKAGEVRVHWWAEASCVRIEVIDRGVGIRESDQARLFDRFYRADPSRARATGGSGLGLSIVRQLAAAQGGIAGAESREGEGSTFWFTLPLA